MKRYQIFTGLNLSGEPIYKKRKKIDFLILIDSDSLVLLYDGIVGFIRIDVFYIEKLKKQDKGLTREQGPNLHLDFSLVKFWYLWYLKTE